MNKAKSKAGLYLVIYIFIVLFFMFSPIVIPMFLFYLNEVGILNVNTDIAWFALYSIYTIPAGVVLWVLGFVVFTFLDIKKHG